MKTMYFNRDYQTIHTVEEMQEFHKGYCLACNSDISFAEWLAEATGKNGTMEELKVKSIWKIDTGERIFKTAYIVFTNRTNAEGSFDDAINYARKSGYDKANGGQKQDFNCLSNPCIDAVSLDFEIEEWEE
jgi:hypothetical protein